MNEVVQATLPLGAEAVEGIERKMLRVGLSLENSRR